MKLTFLLILGLVIWASSSAQNSHGVITRYYDDSTRESTYSYTYDNFKYGRETLMFTKYNRHSTNGLPIVRSYYNILDDDTFDFIIKAKILQPRRKNGTYYRFKITEFKLLVRTAGT